MASPSEIVQLHTTTCLRFVSTTMHALNPNLLKSATSESVVVGPGNVTLLTLWFSQLTLPDERKVYYQALQPKFHPYETQQLVVQQNTTGNQVLKIGRSQSSRMDRRQPSFSTTSSSNPSPRHHTYVPVSRHSELDDHLLYHQTRSTKCRFCKACIPSHTSNKPSTSSYPSFRTFHSKTKHNGKHSNFPECMQISSPQQINMMNYPLPRDDKDKSSPLPQRNLGPGNFTPTFNNNSLATHLDFVQYRNIDVEKSFELIRMQNYSNYQSVCLAHKLHDIAQDILQTKSHFNGIHYDL
jgi:hypothetical protein